MYCQIEPIKLAQKARNEEETMKNSKESKEPKQNTNELKMPNQNNKGKQAKT